MWSRISSLLLLALCAAAQERIEAFRTIMGTQFRVTVHASGVTAAQRAVQRAFLRGEELDLALSDYKTDSELNRLCRAGRMRVSEDLFAVLKYSREVSRQSRGLFDVTLGPYTVLWRARTMPSAAALAEARARTGWKKVRLNAGTREVTLARRDMQLDLGGIAKGYAADAMLRVLRDAGFPQALVAASGDLAIGDAPPGRAGWKVDVLGEVREMARCGVSTSGDETQFVEIGGVRYSHIVDPRTGLGMRSRTLVTVIARTAMESDAWATAIAAGAAARPSGIAVVVR